jgi:hypothetical protein
VNRAVCLLAALVVSSCARPALKLPSGSGTPASDGREVLMQATAACAAIRTFTAEVGLSGKIQGHRLRARLLVGTAAPSSARVEAVAPAGAPMFIFAARDGNATLLLPRDNRVLQHAKSEDILAALAGVPLDAEDLRLTLTGCSRTDSTATAARAFGDSWRAVDLAPDDIVTIHKASAAEPWRLVAVRRRTQHGGWLATYADFQNGLPRSVRMTSAASTGSSVYDLQLSVSQAETNVPLDDEAFRVKIPADATPISLDELRRARPGAREN